MALTECRHGRPECECQSPRAIESSGRWDANGNIFDAIWDHREKAFQWASNLDLKKLHWCITVMASDTNAFTLYERKALLEVVALKLGKEIHEET